MTDQSRFARATTMLIVTVFASLVLLPLTAPVAAQTVESRQRTTQLAVITFSPDLANTAEQLAALVDPVAEQVGAVHDYKPARPYAIRLYNNTNAYDQAYELARTPYGQIAVANPRTGELMVAEPRLRNQTPEQVRNLLRRGLSQLLLHEVTGGRLPIGILQGAAQYAEHSGPEVEVGARLLDRARREQTAPGWADLNRPEVFQERSEVAAAQGYAVVAFLLDRYGLAAWQRYLAAVRTTPDMAAAMQQAYGKPMATLETEWQGYLPEYFGGSFAINYFARYDLGAVRTHMAAGRYVEARDEVEVVARFINGAGRAAKEAELREFVRQINLGLEGEQALGQGHQIMATFDYAGARDAYQRARERFDSLGATPRVTQADEAIARATAGVAALEHLAAAQRMMAELNYGDARTAAEEGSRVFAELGDEQHYRQAYQILVELNRTQTIIAYVLATIGVANVLWAFWRLGTRTRRRAVPGVLR
jgi:hypothetical protein